MVYLNNTTNPQDVYIPRQDRLNVEKTGIDLSAYLTSGETIELINETVDAEIDERNLVNSAETQNMIDSSLSGYATEEWVENKGYLTEQSLDDYWTSAQTESAITEATENFVTSADVETQITEKNYTTSAETKEQIEAYNYVNSGQVQTQIEESLSGIELTNYWTSEETQSAITEATENLVTSADVETQITEKNYVTSAETKQQIEDYNYATSGDVETQITGKNYITSGDAKTQIEGYNYTTSAETKTQIEDYHYITSGEAQNQINTSLSGYATEQWVQNQGYLTEHQSLSGLVASAEYVSTAKTIYFYNNDNTVLSTIDATDFIKDGMVDSVTISGSNLIISFNTDAGKEDITIPLTDIFDPANYYTKTDIDNKHYVNSAETKTQIEGYNYITSAQAQTQIEESLSGVDLTNYYTSAQTDTAIANAQYGNKLYVSNVTKQLILRKSDGQTNTVLSSTFYKTINDESILGSSGNISLPTSADVKTQIEGYNYVTSGDVETQITGKNYITANDIPTSNSDFTNDAGYITSADTVDFITSADAKTQIESYNYITSGQAQTQIENSLSGVDLTNYWTSAQTDNAITAATSTKQDTLVSGENIKTINNQSLLGEGNITIQGGGGSGGETVVELTKAQYQALSAYSEYTTYIITDADAVDLNDFATSGDIQTLSAITSGLSETKADKVSVSANNNYYFPAWNNQGVITGTTGNRMYQVNIGINGSNQSIVRTTNSNIASIYAPTSAGTAKQIVTSNGSGAPVWTTYKFDFISQSSYDALVLAGTTDASTIYFIIDEN